MEGPACGEGCRTAASTGLESSKLMFAPIHALDMSGTGLHVCACKYINNRIYFKEPFVSMHITCYVHVACMHIVICA